MTRAILLSALALAACANAPVAVPEAIPTAAAEPEWRAVDPENLIVLELATGTTYIELFPEAAPAHVAQIRQLVRDGFYDGEAFYRVIEGHVAQAGREFEQEITGIPTLPFEAERAVSAEGFTPHGNADLFAPEPGHRMGFAVGREGGQEWLLNCPGALGMARDTPPESGSTEIFIPLQPRRYLDRNYTIFGRVIAGMEHVHRLPRVDPATEEEAAALYGDDPELAYQLSQWRRAKLDANFITSAKVAADMPEDERPVFEVMNTASAEWAALKESKRDYSAIDAFVSTPPKVLDICTLPVPARRENGG
ncbi:peptidylprolyl isomerase [Hyphomonas sp.]|uniref:peptidylprolyl isomerase n=1 Tax=Hyphomonas sp. TaxID=87 RepID=UPI00391AC3BE